MRSESRRSVADVKGARVSRKGSLAVLKRFVADRKRSVANLKGFVADRKGAGEWIPPFSVPDYFLEAFIQIGVSYFWGTARCKRDGATNQRPLL